MNGCGRLLFSVLICAAVPVGCGEDEGRTSGAASGQGTQAPLRGRTEDGYDVVFSGRNKSAGPATPAPDEHLVNEPNSPDPHGGTFSLDEAVDGLPIDGQLVAEIRTELGTIFCDLHADRVPNTVANFIGLARGKRAHWDARAGAWTTRPLYNGTAFHRVIPEYLIQAGDPMGDGTGTVGYLIPDEQHPTLRHDKAGQLCMAPIEENQNGGQFFITDGARPDLDGSYTIFGQCAQTELVSRIARVPQSGRPDHRPLTPVHITRLMIQRVPGGSAEARITSPRLPEGYDPEHPARGASAGPSEIRQRLEERRRLRAEEQGEPHAP